MGLNFEKVIAKWLKSGTEPPDTLKQQGFKPGYKPPAEYFNWFWSSVTAAINELQEKLSTAVFGTPIVTAESTDGVTYTATIDGITELTAGLTITIIPNTVSTSISAKLDLNGLGAKYIRQSTTNNTTTGLTPKNANWMAANKPVTIQYDGTQWKTIAARSNASDLNGIVAIANGGTGATSAEDARTNLELGAMALEDNGIVDASINGKVITLTFADGTTKTLTTQDTVPSAYITAQAYNYRKWSDGTLEMWGYKASSGTTEFHTITLPVALTTTTNAFVLTGFDAPDSGTSSGGWPAGSLGYSALTTTNIKIYIYTHTWQQGVNWYVKGKWK